MRSREREARVLALPLPGAAEHPRAARAALPNDRFLALDQVAAAVRVAATVDVPGVGGGGARRLAVALALHLAHQARRRGAGDEPLGAVTLDPARLAPLLRTTAAGVESALAVLSRGGLARPAITGEIAHAGSYGAAARPAWSLDPVALREARGAEALVDWTAVAESLHGAPSAWVAMHVLAAHLDGGAWGQLALGAVGECLGGSENTVRKAIGQLVELQLVERQNKPGDRACYRLPPTLLLGTGGPTSMVREQPRSATPNVERGTLAQATSATGSASVALPAGSAPGARTASGRMRVVRQDGVVVLRVPEEVPLTFVTLSDGRVVPQVGDPERQTPYTVELE